MSLGTILTATKYQLVAIDRIQFNRNTEFSYESGEFSMVPLREPPLDLVDPSGFTGIIVTSAINTKSVRAFNVTPACLLCHVSFKEGDSCCDVYKQAEACLQISMNVRLEDDDGRSIRCFLDTQSFCKITGREQGESLDEVINMDSSLDFVQEIVGRRVQVAVTSNCSPISGGSPPVHTIETILTREDFTGEASQQKRTRRRR